MGQHHAAAILPCRDIAATSAFYVRLGFEVVSDFAHQGYRILADGRGWHLHLHHAGPESLGPPHNPFGLYLYVEDVDAVVDRVRGAILTPGAPELKPWGVYEFAVSDPDGVLVRVGRVAS